MGRAGVDLDLDLMVVFQVIDDVLQRRFDELQRGRIVQRAFNPGGGGVDLSGRPIGHLANRRQCRHDFSSANRPSRLPV